MKFMSDMLALEMLDLDVVLGAERLHIYKVVIDYKKQSVVLRDLKVNR